MSSLGQSLTQSLIQAGIERLNGVESVKLGNAKEAASNVYASVSGWPVVGPFLAPELAAVAFAAVMAFEKGGIVPDKGLSMARGTDSVPAMLTPGEAVLPREMTGLLMQAAKNGGGSATIHNHHYHYRPQVHAIDGPSVEKMLDTHGDKFAKKMHYHMRKMNK